MERRRGWRPFRSEEYQESDMFDLMEDREAIDYTKPRESEQRSIGLVSRQLPSAIMLIPRAKKSSNPEPKLVQHSAPVNIPNWSKIYGKSPVGDSSRSSLFNNQDCFDGCDNDSENFVGKSYIQNSNDDEDEDDDDDDEMEGRIPPHEWLAKKQRRKQISPFSVCEGAGRTLKGRDLRRVRHAVLTKTGFI